MVRQFYKSNYRYLHLSFHGVNNCGEPVDKFALTLDQIDYLKFAQILIKESTKAPNEGVKRRLFISACNVTENISQIFKNKENTFMSIIAPSIKIKTRIAPIAWATFYNKVFETEPNKLMEKKDMRMQNKRIKEHLNNICAFYKIRFRAHFKKQNKNHSESYNFPIMS